MPTLDLQTNASENDAGETAAGVAAINTTTLRLFASSAAWIGFRFTGATIPRGSTIDVAYVETFCNNAGRDTADATIWCEGADSPAVFTTNNNDISGRTRTTASVTWSAANILGDTGNQFIQWPSLVSIIQEVVDRPGFDENTIVIIANDNGASDLQITTWDGNPGNAPKLHIEYTPPQGGSWVRALRRGLQRGLRAGMA